MPERSNIRGAVDQFSPTLGRVFSLPLEGYDAFVERLQGREPFPGQEKPQETIGTYSPQPPDMAGAFAGAQQLSPAVVQTIIAESLGEGPEGMRLVAETIMNRARERGITPEQVVMERGQYAPHSYRAGAGIDLDSPKNIAAATKAWGVAQGPEDPTMGAEYFYAGDTPPSATERLQVVYEHGNHRFLADQSTVKEMQTNLKAQGLYDGAIDGDFGPATRTAANAFRAQLGTDDPVQALTSLGVEPAAGQEAITNILQSPESLPAFQNAAAAPPTDPRLDALRQRMETDPAALQEAMATTPLPDMGGQPLPDVLQAQAPASFGPDLSGMSERMRGAIAGGPNEPAVGADIMRREAERLAGHTPLYGGQGVVDAAQAGEVLPAPQQPAPAPAPPPAGQASVDATGAPVPYAGDYNDILDNGAPAGPDRQDLTSVTSSPTSVPGSYSEQLREQTALNEAAALRGYGPSEVPDAPAPPPDMAGDPYSDANIVETLRERAANYADFETTRANVRSPDTLRDMMGQAGLDDSQWAATDLGIPSQAIPSSNLPPLMQQQYEQAARRDWARPQAPEEAPPQYDTRLEQIQEGQYRIGAPFNAEAEAAEAAAVRERLANANPARLLRDEREMASIARTQPIGPPESRNYRIGQGLRPDLQETVGIGGPDAPPFMAEGSVPPSPQATADIGLTAMPNMTAGAADAIFAPSELTSQDIANIQQQRANPPAGGIRGWAYDQNGRVVAVGTPTAPAPAPAAPASAPAVTSTTGTYGDTAAPAATAAAAQMAGVQSAGGTPDVLSYYGIERGAANLMSGVKPRMAGTRGGNLTTITTNGGQKFTVNADAAPSFQGFLNEMEASGYPVSSSGGYNERKKTSGKGWSEHSYGTAIDINSVDNPYQEDFDDGMQTDMPENVSDIAAKWGLSWGGDFDSVKDPMHFEWQGLTADQVAEGQANAPDLSSPEKITALQTSLRAAGHDVTVDGVMGPETRAALVAQNAKTPQTATTQTATISTPLQTMIEAMEANNLHHLTMTGDTITAFQDEAGTKPWTPEQQAKVATAVEGVTGSPVSMQYGELRVAPAAVADMANQLAAMEAKPEAATTTTTAVAPAAAEAPAAEAPAAAAAPVSTMRDVAMAAHDAGFIGRIDIDPVTNRVSGYNHGMGGKYPNGQPWTAEQRATIAAAVPGIVVDADGGLSLPPAAPAAAVPAGVTGTSDPVEAKPGSVVQPPAAAVPLDQATPAATDEAPDMVGGRPNAVQLDMGTNAVGVPEGAAGLPNTGPTAAAESLEAIGNTLTPLAPDMVGGTEGAVGLPNTGPTAAAESLQGIADAFNQPSQLSASGLPETQPGAISAVPPPVAITGTEVAEGPGTAVAPTDGRVQLTAPAGSTLYNTMDGPVVIDAGPLGPDNLGVLDAGPRTSPLPPVMSGKEKDDYLGPTTRVVQTVPITPGPAALIPNVPVGTYSFVKPPTGKEEDDYIGPAPVPAPVAPLTGKEEDDYIGPPAVVAPVQQAPVQQAPVEKKTFQEKTEAASGRSKTWSDPVEYAARNSVTEDGKFDHDKFWDQLGDVDLTQTQQTVAAKTAAQGHFTQNKGFLSGLNMPDMGGMKNMLGNVGDVAGAIPNPVNALGNFFGGIFGGGGFDPRSSAIGSDYAASQNYGGYGSMNTGNYAGGSMSGGGYGSQSYGGSYSGPGSYNGGGGSQYGSGFGGGGGYGGAGTYGGAGGSNIGSGIGGAFRNR